MWRRSPSASCSCARRFSAQTSAQRRPAATSWSLTRSSPTALGAALASRETRVRFECRHSCSDVLTRIIGARRAWTVSMISALSMPWR